MKARFATHIVVLLLFAFSPAPGQRKSAEPDLLGTFFRGDFSEFQYRMAQKLLEHDSNTNLVIRICSARPIVDAIATAAGLASSAGQAYEISRMLKAYGISPDRVILATYGGCDSGSRKGFSQIEYWTVSPEERLQIVESIPLSNVKITFLLSGSGKDEYKSARHKILETSRSTGGHLYVVGVYDKRLTSPLRKNVKDSVRYLTNRARNAKVKAYFLESDRIVDEDDRESLYPVFVKVELSDIKQSADTGVR